MIEFKSQYDENSPEVVFTLHSDSTLPAVLETFQHFLKATGYVFSGELDIYGGEDDESEF